MWLLKIPATCNWVKAGEKEQTFRTEKVNANQALNFIAGNLSNEITGHGGFGYPAAS